MTKKSILAIVLNVMAIVAPVSAVAVRYGVDTPIAMDNADAAFGQLMAIGAAVLSGFLMAVLAGRLVSADDSTLSKTALKMVHEVRARERQRAA